MSTDAVPSLVLIVLFAQSVLFAGWVVVTLSIVWGMFRRTRSGEAAYPGATTRGTVARMYLRDPATRWRRRIWLALTLGVVAAFVLTQVLLATV